MHYENLPSGTPARPYRIPCTCQPGSEGSGAPNQALSGREEYQANGE